MTKIGILLMLFTSSIIVSCTSTKKSTNQNDVARDPKSFSRSVCLMEEPKEAGWKEISQVLPEILELRSRIYKPAMLNIPDPTEIWYEAPNRLLMCSTAGASLCGHGTYKFKREESQWKEDGGVITMCELRRK